MSKLRLGTLLAIVVGLCSALALPALASAATPGNISGKVTNASTGEPIAFTEVCAYKAATFELGGCDLTDFEGNYLIDELEAGSYKVEFQGNGFAFEGGFLTQWYNGKSSFATADPVAVTEGETTEGIDAAMQERGGKISGKATDATNGAGIGGIEVCASGTGEFFFGNCVTTDANGEYTISFLGAGSYVVEFFSPYKYNSTLERSELEGPNYVRQFYNGKAHREEADAVTVSEGSTTSNINASMQPGGTISGTTTDAASGNAVQGIFVCAWGANTRVCSQTDTGGNYSIPTLPTDSYKVEFQPDYFFLKDSEFEKEHWKRTDFPAMDYLRQYWNEKFSFEAAEPVTVSGGSTVTGINAKMTKEVQPPPPVGTAKIAGKVKVKGSTVLLPLRCAGPGDCSGTLKLTARSTTTANKKGKGRGRHHKRSRVVTIGKQKFSIHAGTRAVVKVKLNGAGRTLLTKAGGKGVKATLSGSGVTRATVTLKGKAPRRKHHKH